MPSLEDNCSNTKLSWSREDLFPDKRFATFGEEAFILSLPQCSSSLMATEDTKRFGINIYYIHKYIMVQELIIQRSSSILIKYLQELSPNWAIIAKIGNWKLETQNWKSKNPKIQKIMRNKFGNFTNLLKISWLKFEISRVGHPFFRSFFPFGFWISFIFRIEIRNTILLLRKPNATT